MTRTETDYRVALAWYVKYPLDAYAIGPYRFEDFVGADTAVAHAAEQFGEPPCEVWPDGPVREVAEYEFEVDARE